MTKAFPPSHVSFVTPRFCSACEVHPPLVGPSGICTDSETTEPPKFASEKKQGREGVVKVLVVNLMACASAGMSLAARYSGDAGGMFFSALAVIFGVATCYVVSGLQVREVVSEEVVDTFLWEGGNYPPL